MFKSIRLHSLKITALLLVCSFSAVLISACNQNGKLSDEDLQKVTNPATTVAQTTSDNTGGTEENLPANPINFDELTALNSDLYAWIKIPNTVIDYPVAQSSVEDDNFYLHHDYLGNYQFAGTIYSHRLNSKYFVDRVNVFYGHNMLDGSMFAELHKFSNQEFFDENDTIYVYTKGHILTYKIFAAYEYDDRHILNSFDFTDDKVYSDYLNDCLNPHSGNSIVREGVELDLDSKLLTLSTCTDYNSSLRYLVQGVLVNDQRTK